MKIGYVFTNFNNADYTRNAIESIIKLENHYSVVVVDNNSDEEDKNKLRKLEETYKNVSVIYSDKNVGYFNGLNLGILYLRKFVPYLDCMIVGNNDIVFPSNFIESLLQKKEIFERYPVISPDIVTVDGFHQNPHVIKNISRIREMIYDIYHWNYLFAKIILKLAAISGKFGKRGDEEHWQVSKEIYQGYGACYILTPLFFQIFEKLYSPSFLMYEEYFLSLQLEEKGYKVFYEPSISITHYMHASTNKLPGKTKWNFSRESHKIHRQTNKIINK